jgi:hypothetical protein
VLLIVTIHMYVSLVILYCIDSVLISRLCPHSVWVNSFTSGHSQVGFNHLLDKFIEGRLGNPTNDILDLGRISQQQLDLGRTEVSWINLDQDTRLVGGIDTDLVDGSESSDPLDGGSDNSKGLFNKLSDTVYNRKRKVS